MKKKYSQTYKHTDTDTDIDTDTDTDTKRVESSSTRELMSRVL